MAKADAPAADAPVEEVAPEAAPAVVPVAAPAKGYDYNTGAFYA